MWIKEVNMEGENGKDVGVWRLIFIYKGKTCAGVIR